MSENIPPADSTRGVPYYEKLKRDLRDTLQKKTHLDKTLAALEDQIYRHETSYLEDTSAGNIIRGFDNYIKSSSTVSSLPSSANNASTGAAGGGAGGGGGGGGGGGTASRRKVNVIEQDRVFSRSSTAYAREVSPGCSPQVESQGVTPTSGFEVGTPTTGGGGVGRKGGDNKKKKGGVEDEDGEAKAPKRLKITYSRAGKAGD